MEDFSKWAETFNKAKTDVIIYNGEINYDGAYKITELACNTQNTNVALYLTTQGGSPDAAYKIANILQEKYTHFELVVNGFCKSAGTLIACGSDSLAMSDFGELGPLDAQVTDDGTSRHSTLDIIQAFNSLQSKASKAYLDYLKELHNSEAGDFLNRTEKQEAALNLTKILCDPIAEQITPVKLGSVERSTQIAAFYANLLQGNGTRGNIDISQKDTDGLPVSVKALISSFPCHSAVINKKLANLIFKKTRILTSSEVDFVKTNTAIMTFPFPEIQIKRVNDFLIKKQHNETHDQQSTKAA